MPNLNTPLEFPCFPWTKPSIECITGTVLGVPEVWRYVASKIAAAFADNFA
jgi:hypothetical protein